MTAVEMVNRFYDVLENTNPAFSTTRLRPIVDVVLGYINEAQLSFFKERYLPGDTLTNINTLKLLRQELLQLVKEEVIEVEEHSTKRNHITLLTPLEGIFMEGFISIYHSLIDMRDEHGDELFTATEIVPVTLGSIGKFLTNHTNYPILLQPVIALGSVGVERGYTYSPDIIKDTMTTVEVKDGASHVYITTVLLPSLVSIENEVGGIVEEGCKLHPQFHEIIVRIAVEMFLREKGAFANQERVEE